MTLEVSSSISNDVVLGEESRLSLYPMYLVKCITFDDAERHTWISYVKNVLVTNIFSVVWISQGVRYIDTFIYIFKQGIYDISKRTWFSDIVNNTTYCSGWLLLVFEQEVTRPSE